MKKLLACLGLILASNFSSATIYDFTWNDGAQDILSGYVDTTQDALFVTQFNPWTPGSGSYIDPLIPDFSNSSVFANNAWELKAVQADGSGFDIADDWDGLLGGWGFASDLEMSDIPYLNGSFDSGPYFKHYMAIGLIKTYFPYAGFYSYDVQGGSSFAPDGSVYSQLSDYAGYYSPASGFDTSTANQFQTGGSHRIEKRIDAPEPGTLAIFLLGFAALLARRFSLCGK